LITGSTDEIYLIEICYSSKRHFEKVARMYPNFKAIVFFYDNDTCCRTLGDRPIRRGEYRHRIITEFPAGKNPIYDVLNNGTS
jgi:hypothetical protein